MDFQERIVLIIDDDEAYRLMFRKLIIENFNAKVRMAENPIRAFELLREFTPDLIILDMQMPAMDGLTALNAIRTHDKLRHVPVIAATALQDPLLVQLLVERGIADFILKPFSAPIALEKIGAVLQKLPPAPASSSAEL